MTHGDEKGVLLTHDSTTLKVTDLWEPFSKCQKLVEKPKLFFIEACKGGKIETGVVVREQKKEDEPMTSSDNDKRNCTIIPTFPHLLVHYSSLEGFSTYSSTCNGSWFIQSLCEKLKHYLITNQQEINLMEILIAVNRQVAIKFKTHVDNKHFPNAKQQPHIVDTFLKLMIFNRKI